MRKKNQANMRTLLAILLSWGYKSLLKMTYCGTVNSKMATVKKNTVNDSTERTRL